MSSKLQTKNVFDIDHIKNSISVKEVKYRIRPDTSDVIPVYDGNKFYYYDNPNKGGDIIDIESSREVYNGAL